MRSEVRILPEALERARRASYLASLHAREQITALIPYHQQTKRPPGERRIPRRLTRPANRPILRGPPNAVRKALRHVLHSG